MNVVTHNTEETAERRHPVPARRAHGEDRHRRGDRDPAVAAFVDIRRV